MAITIPSFLIDLREVAIWLAAIIVAVTGLRYAKVALVYFLEKLYELFIQNTSTAI